MLLYQIFENQFEVVFPISINTLQERFSCFSATNICTYEDREGMTDNSNSLILTIVKCELDVLPLFNKPAGKIINDIKCT